MEELPFKLESGQPAAPARKKRRVRWWLIATIILAPMAVLWLAWFGFRIGWTLRENSGRAQMAAQLQELRDRGIPVDDQGVQQQYVESTSQADLEAWYAVFERLQDEDFLADFDGVRYIDSTVDVDEFDDPFPIGDEWPSASTAISATKKHRDVIEEIRRLASSDSPVGFPLFFQATATLLPGLQESRGMARLLFCDCQVAVHLGDAERAAQDIIAMGELAKHAEAVPFAIARVVGIVFRRQALTAMQSAIRIGLFGREQLQQLDRYCTERSEIGLNWQALILGEMSAHLSVFSNPAVAMESATPIPARGHDGVYFIDLMQRAANTDVFDFVEFHRASLVLSAEVDDASSSWLEMADRLLSRLLAPPFSTYAELMINDCIQHRLARLAIACRLFELDHQTLPERLGELPEELVSIEPLRGQRFGYVGTNKSITLWGVFFSSETQEIADQVPELRGPTVEVLNNRSVVWTLEH